jgi:hypothetical protein
MEEPLEPINPMDEPARRRRPSRARARRSWPVRSPGSWRCTLTITSFDGSTVTVTTSPSTNVTKMQSISLGDLEVNENVVVRGTTANDGSVTANDVQTGMGNFGFGRRGAVGPGGPGGADDDLPQQQTS